MTISSISSRRSPSPTETESRNATPEVVRSTTPPPPTEGLQALSLKQRDASASSSAAMAPRGATPLAATASLPTPAAGTAKQQRAVQGKPSKDLAGEFRQMQRQYDSCVSDFNADPSHASALKLLDVAARQLSRRAELDRSTAIRLMSDNDVMTVDCDVGLALYQLSAPMEEALELHGKRLKAVEQLYDTVSKQNAGLPPAEQRSLTPTIQGVIKETRARLALFEQRMEQMLALAPVHAHTVLVRLPDPRERAELARSDASSQATDQFNVLNSNVQLARWALLSAQSEFPPALKDAVLDEKGSVRALTHLLDDIDTAFRSTVLGEVLRNDGEGNLPALLGRPLDSENQQVLEAMIGRLGEFGVAVEELRAKLLEHSVPTNLNGVDVPTQLTKIAEEAWLMASTLSKRLELDQAASSPSSPPTAQQAAASWEVTLPQAAASSSAKRRSNNKSKTKARRREQEPVASAGTAASTARPAAGARAEEASPSPAKKQMVRTKLGTPMLVSAEEAAKAAAAAEAAKQRLQNLDELRSVDVSAYQRALSHAREGVSPENGTYAVREIVGEMEVTAAAMKRCLAPLEAQQERMQLTEQRKTPELHENVVELRTKLHQLEGLTKAATGSLEVAEIEHVKTYRLPRQKHIERLLGGGHLAPIGKPQALEGNPGTLFEVKLQPLPLRNGTTPKPIWLHVHTKAPVHAHQLTQLDDSSFGASHLKNDEERHRGRKWQNARAAEGYERTMIHRGKVLPKFCKELLGGQ